MPTSDAARVLPPGAGDPLPPAAPAELPARASEPLWNLFALAFGVLFLVSVPLGWWHPELGAVRNGQIALVALGALALLVRGRGDTAPLRLRTSTRRFFLASGCLYLLAVSLSRYAAFEVNAYDFSIFDQMLENTLRGHFLYTQIYRVNHLGVHASYVMLPLVLVHAVWRSPWMLVVLGGVLVALAGLAMWRLAVARCQDERFALLAVCALWTHPWMGVLISHGFRIESFFPLGTVLLLLGWTERREAITWTGAGILLATKEDACLYVAAFAVAGLLVDRSRWRGSLALLVTSVAMFLADVRWIQPLMRGGTAAPPYVTAFWSGYGSTLGAVAITALTHPLRVAHDVATSGALRFFGPMLGLPLLEVESLLPMLPLIALLGIATAPAMHRYGGYYAMPLVAFALYGILRFAQRPGRGRRLAAGLSLALCPLIGEGYVRTPRPKWATLKGLTQAESSLAGDEAPLCVQSGLFPHVAYGFDTYPLDGACLGRTGAVGLLATSVNAWPFQEDDVERWLHTGRARRFPGGVFLLRH